MNKKHLIPSLLGLVAVSSVLGSCNNTGGDSKNCYIGVYGADNLDVKILCDGKENNLQFGKEVVITCSPKIENAEGSEKRKLGLPASYVSLNPITGLAGTHGQKANPYVGYGNKVYHPYDYRLTKGLSYTWKPVEDSEAYTLTIPAEYFKSNIIVSFDDSLWALQRMMGGQPGVDYPEFGDDCEYHGINEYRLDDIFDSSNKYNFPDANNSYFENEYNSEYDNDLHRTNAYDSESLANDGIVITFEKSSWDFLTTLEGINEKNFALEVVEPTYEGSHPEEGVKITESGSFSVDTIGNYVLCTIPWEKIYKTEGEGEEKKIVKKYGTTAQNTLYFRTATCNLKTKFNHTDENDLYGFYYRGSAVYKNRAITTCPYNFSASSYPQGYYHEETISNYVNEEDGKLKSTPEIEILFKSSTSEKTVKINGQSTKESYSGNIDIYNNRYYFESDAFTSSETSWVWTCMRFFDNSTDKTYKFSMISLTATGASAFYYPGTSNYASYVNLTIVK